MTKTLTKPYVGIGGWTYEPWRGVFYPKGLTHARELEYAGQHLTSIEVNGTFYSTQSPKTYRKWASEVPDGFVFSLKGPRYAVNRRVLAEAETRSGAFSSPASPNSAPSSAPCSGNSRRTRNSTKRISARSSICCRKKFNGHGLRHVVEVRNDTFKTSAFIDLVRKRNIAICYAEHDTYTEIADITADFVYARLQKGDEKLKAGYPPKALDAWAKRVETWLKGGEPTDLPRVDKTKAKKTPRDVFVYFIHEAKLRAPAAAMALIERLK